MPFEKAPSKLASPNSGLTSPGFRLGVISIAILLISVYVQTMPRSEVGVV